MNLSPNQDPDLNRSLQNDTFTAEDFRLHLPIINKALTFFKSNHRLNSDITKILEENPEDIKTFIINIGTMARILRSLRKKANKDEFRERKQSKIIKFSELKAKKLKEKDLILNRMLNSQLGGVQTEVAAPADKSMRILRKLIQKKPKVLQRTYSRKSNSKCYVCKKYYESPHHFYDQLCPKCGDFNFDKRNQKCDFTGKIALVTGGRVKIGYQITLYLLRNNCTVVVTSRFNKDCFTRFTQESDFDLFKDRLTIYPLDLRDLSGVLEFVGYLNNKLPKLDILINNAAQTIRRHPAYYQHLLDVESKPLDSFNNVSIYQCLPQDFGALDSAAPNSLMLQLPYNNTSVTFEIQPNKVSSLGRSVLQSQIPVLSSDLNSDLNLFPRGVLDTDSLQVDLSNTTSWDKQLNDIDIFEFAETQVINSWAPFILCSKLKDLMSRNPNQDKFVVNVASMEGKFDYYTKSTKHPHTNMSKAALNMLTRTCGGFLARSRIYMNSADTGWVSEMEQTHLLQKFRTAPLNEVDGAMRVLDPIIVGINEGNPVHSLFFKDYKSVTW